MTEAQWRLFMDLIDARIKYYRLTPRTEAWHDLRAFGANLEERVKGFMVTKEDTPDE